MYALEVPFSILRVLLPDSCDPLLKLNQKAISALRCDTSRTVPGSIPDGVTGFFSDIFPSDGTMAMGRLSPQ
jgi:hypothetical protein